MTELELAIKAHSDQIAEKQKELETSIGAKAAELKGEIDKLEQTRVKMQEQLDQIATDLKKAEKAGAQSGEKDLSFTEALEQLYKSEEFQNAKKDGFRKVGTFELKAGTSVITGAVNLTTQNMTVGFAKDRPLAFLPYLNAGVVANDKNRVLWVEGAYTSNAGYVGEGTGPATADTGVAVEKSRAMAKISAKLPLTAEILEDASYVANAFRMKLQDRSMLFTDKEFYTGDGNDSTAANHIYGIVGHATAFNATTAGVNLKIEKANIGDLIDSMCLQAKLKEYTPTILWVNPADFMLMKKAKSSTGEYLFVKDVNGNYNISGLRVVESSAVTANTMTVADASVIQAWWKRNPEIKFSQMNGTDFTDDAFTAVLFLRAQCVVEAADKLGIIHVADIGASITAITKV